MAALRRLLSKRQTPPSFACGNVLRSLGAAVVSCCGALFAARRRMAVRLLQPPRADTQKSVNVYESPVNFS